MPSLIGAQLGGGASGTIGQNYLKASPSTRFGTRELSVVVVELTDIATNYANADSLFSQTVRAIQQHAEVYGVFTPANGRATILVAADTQPQDTGDYAGEGSSNSYFGSILEDAGIIGATVWNAGIFGDNISYD